jgi:hypothetical protein
MLELTKIYAKKNTILAIDITNQHKARLYEMSNNIIENVNPNCKIYILDRIIKIPKQGPKEFGYNDFHWFELCTTHLAFHIMGEPLEYLKYSIEYAMNPNRSEIEHPIDVLYKEYEKVKDLFMCNVGKTSKWV